MRARYGLAWLALGIGLALAPAAASAKAPKPPKALCLDFDSGGGDLIGAFAIKSVGKVTTAAGSASFYQIAGELVFALAGGGSYPVAGAGHVLGNVLHFDVTGQTYSDLYGGFTSFHVEGEWDLLAATGTTSGHLMVENAGSVDALEVLSMGLVGIDCATVGLPY